MLFEMGLYIQDHILFQLYAIKVQQVQIEYLFKNKEQRETTNN